MDVDTDVGWKVTVLEQMQDSTETVLVVIAMVAVSEE